MSSEKLGTYSVRPIGRVVSSVREGDEMPIDGVAASIEVYPEFEAGLAGLESNSHVIILGWFHKAEREKLTMSRPGSSERGVFGLRSPGRPNPVGLTSARVLGVEGRVLKLDRLDMIDGTPIVDIKRYSPGWDAIFSARTTRDMEHPGNRNRESFLKDMIFEAENFHGERCEGVELGARMVDHAIHEWGIGKKESGLRVGWGPDGCVNDALQAITGATCGNGRLDTAPRDEYVLWWKNQELRFGSGEGNPHPLNPPLP